MLPAVVSIEARKKPVKGRRGPDFDPAIPEELRKFFEGMQPQFGEDGPSPRQGFGSGVIVGDNAYVVNEPSVVCIDLKTGKQTWEKNIPGAAWGSIVHSDGKLYLTSQSAQTMVFQANPKEYEEIALNKLDGATTRASIVPSDGEFFVRTYKHLWCIGGKK